MHELNSCLMNSEGKMNLFINGETNEFVDIVKLAIIRFYLGTDDKEMKEALEEHTKNTIFDSILDNIDPTLGSGIPLAYK